MLIACLFILGGILLYRFHPAILAALSRFDQRNRARIEAEIRDKSDGLAHFRHTLALAEEQIEPVNAIAARDERTGLDITRYVFEGETFASEREAQRARQERVRIKAREFYMELPAALAARGNGKLGKD